MAITNGDAFDAYFEAKVSALSALGYESGWVEIPLEDRRGQHWMLVGGEASGAMVLYSEDPFTEEVIVGGTKFCADCVYTQRFLDKWVYRTPTHVAVCVDTRTDGNRFLAVFDAALECTDDALRSKYKECW